MSSSLLSVSSKSSLICASTVLLRLTVRVSSAVSVPELDVPELGDVELVELVEDDEVVEEFDVSLCVSFLSHCTPMGIVFRVLGRLFRAVVVAIVAGAGGCIGDPGGSTKVPFPVRSITVLYATHIATEPIITINNNNCCKAILVLVSSNNIMKGVGGERVGVG